MRRRAKSIFQEALDHEPGRRAAFVSGAAGGDAGLARAALDLLAAHSRAGEFLGRPTIAPAPLPGANDTSHEELPGARIGRYVLVETIGIGGFGVVWRAEQQEPVRRSVALKVIKLGMDTRQVIARFEAERQALALMDHPNIAQVLDGGATDAGRPYFVMELVRGVPITRFCDENRLSTKARLELFVSVCRAVQHAHTKGVIHRDIKPGNVLVALHDEEPVAKVIDFGIAKATSARLTERTLFTEFQQMIGTPEYMAPEQAEMSGVDVDTRADVYSLGVLLYELLTGAKPFDINALLQRGWDEVVRTIREVEPPKPSTRVSTMGRDVQVTAGAQRGEIAPLARRLRGDLDWIVMKALEKDRERRYETAEALGDDVERHLGDLPVLAGPPSRAYQASKLVRRHRVAFTAAAVVLATLVLGIAFSTWGLIEARDQRDRAEHREQRANAELRTRTQVAQLMSDMLQGAGPAVAQGRDATIVREILAQTAQRVDADLAGQDEVSAALMGVMSAAYREIGDLEQSEALARRCLALRRNHFGPAHPEVGIALAELALTLNERGSLEEAEGCAREGLALLRATPQGRWLHVVNACNHLAAVLVNRGGFEEAERLFREGLELVRTHPEVPRHLATLGLASLGEMARLRGDLAAAEELDTQALAEERARYGDDHPRVINAENNLAVVLLDSGRAEAARERLELVLERAQRVHGEASVVAAGTLENLAQASERLKEDERAAREYDGAIAAYRAARAGDHADLARALYRRGHLARRTGESAAARAALQSSVEMSRRVAGAKRAWVASALADLAWIEHERGEPGEAEALMRQAVEASTQSAGAGARATGLLHNELAGLLLEARRPAEALDAMRAALAILRESPGADLLETVKMLANVSDAARHGGDLRLAESSAREGIDLYRARLPDDELGQYRMQMLLFQALTAQGRGEESEPAVIEALRLKRSTLAENDPRHGPMTIEVAQFLLGAGCGEAALRTAREALSIERARAEPDAASFAMVAGTQAALLLLLPDEALLLDEAEALMRECVERVKSGKLDKGIVAGQELLLSVVLTERSLRTRDRAAAEEAELLVRSCLALRERTLKKADWRLAFTRASLGATLAAKVLADPAPAASSTPAPAGAVLVERLPDSGSLQAALTEALELMAPACADLRDRDDVPEVARLLRLPITFAALARVLDALDALDPTPAHRAEAEAWRASALEARSGS